MNLQVLLANQFLDHNPWLPGVAVAVIGIGLTSYWRQRDKDSKHLDYQILSDTPIITSRDKPEILKVVFGETEVSNPYITEIRFKNTGKQVIEDGDFLSSFGIMRGNAKVLDANVVGESEEGLFEYVSVPIDPKNEPVKINPNTLNRGDWFTVQVIYESGDDENITVTGRIKGQTRPPQEYQDREGLTSNARTKMIFGAQFLLVGAVLLLTFTHDGHKDGTISLPFRWLFIGLVVLANILIGFVVWDNSNRLLREFKSWRASKRQPKTAS